VARLELLDADDPMSLASEIEQSGAAHGSKADHCHIERLHRTFFNTRHARIACMADPHTVRLA
jgi:hypothetical protein